MIQRRRDDQKLITRALRRCVALPLRVSHNSTQGRSTQPARRRGNSLMPKHCMTMLLIAIVSSAPLAGAGFQGELEYHLIKTDQQGKIVPWYSSNLGEAYDHNIRL